MLGRFRKKYEDAILPVGRAVGSLGLTPNILSFVSAIASLAAALFYAWHNAPLGALVLLGSASLDMLDGAVARATGTTSRFGAVLDRVLDRYVEYFLVVGIVAGGFITWFWGFFALIGMILASYSRAAAESVGGLKTCTVGVAERQEKLLLIVAGSIFVVAWSSALEYAIIAVGLLSHVTVAQRLMYTSQRTRLS